MCTFIIRFRQIGNYNNDACGKGEFIYTAYRFDEEGEFKLIQIPSEELLIN